MARQFDPAERLQVTRASARAEELTRDFYRIPGHERGRFPYDVSTLADDPGPRPRVFADLVRVVRPASARARRAERQIYRIRLRDDELLAAAEGAEEVGLSPLLLYVLTHELVHVVRFESELATFEDESAERRGVEEKRVHEITKKVLEPLEDALLRTVVDRYFTDERRGRVLG